MTAFYRFRLKPNSEYGYDVFVWEGIAPPTSSYKMVADISIDRTHAAFPSSPAGAMLYRYPITYITEDASEDPKFELNWLVSQYVNEVGVAFPVEWSLRYGLLPETPILTEMFEVAVRVDGVSQAGAGYSGNHSDGTLSIRFGSGGFVSGQTYRVSVYGTILDINTPDPTPAEFWTSFVGSREIV